MSEIDVRLASNEDGDRVHELVDAMGVKIEGLDWSDVYPHWLVAEMEGNIVGTIQVCLGKPIGFIEFLATEDALGHRDRACVVKALYDQAMGALRTYGSQIVSGSIPFEMKAYKRVVKRRGGVILYSGNTFVKRL